MRRHRGGAGVQAAEGAGAAHATKSEVVRTFLSAIFTASIAVYKFKSCCFLVLVVVTVVILCKNVSVLGNKYLKGRWRILVSIRGST